MNCPNCGKNNPVGSQFCSECGTKLFANNVPSGQTINVNNRPAQPQINNINYNNVNNKKIFLPFIIGGVCVFAVVLLVFGVMKIMSVKNSPKLVFDTVIDEVFTKANNFLVTEKINTVSQNYNLDLDLNLDRSLVEPSVYEFINHLNMKGNYQIDYNNKKAIVSLNTLYKNKNLLGGTLYASNNNLYLKLDELYEKYISLPIEKEEYDSIFEYVDVYETMKNSDELLKEIQSALKEVLKEEYFVSEEADVVIGNKTVKTTNSKLVINEKTVLTIFRDMLVSLNNDEFIENTIATIPEGEEQYTKEELKQVIEDEIKKLNETINSEQYSGSFEFSISLYVTSDNDLVKVESKLRTEENAKDQSIFEFTKIEDDKYSLVISDLEGNKVITGSIFENETTVSIDLNVSLEGNEISLKYENVTKAKDSYKTEIMLSASGMGSIKIISELDSNFNEIVSLPSFSNSVLYTELDDYDLQTIMTNIENNDNIKALIEDAGDLFMLFSSFN